VGAPGFNSSQGAAHVYRRGRNWTHAQTLVAADGEEGDGFGSAVALHGLKIAVGAPAADAEFGGEFEQLVRQGAAFVFTRRGIQWVQTQKLRPFDDGIETAIAFGTHIDIDAHRIAIGSPGIGGLVYEGSVFIYERTGRSFTAIKEARTSMTGGYIFSLSCDTLLIGLVELSFYTGAVEVYRLR
jgi:FG-GAP repeat